MSAPTPILSRTETASKGFDPGFLGVSAPLPGVGARPVAELDYTHFSVQLDTTRALAVCAAVNIDGGALIDLPRPDDWQIDPRVPASEQSGEEVYERNSLDRGHLVRRRDACWGDPESAQHANTDTFHYVNAAPQVAIFNQSKDLWLGLETYVLDAAAAAGARLSVLTGPVLADDAPPSLRESDPTGPGLGLGLGAYRTYQVPITDVETLTGLDFAVITAADRMAMRLSARPGQIDLGRWVPLDGVEHVSA